MINIVNIAGAIALLLFCQLIYLTYLELWRPLKFKIVSVQCADSTTYYAYCSRYGVLWSRVGQGPEQESEHGRGYLESTNIEVVRKEVVRRVTEIRENTSEIRKTVGEWNVHA